MGDTIDIELVREAFKSREAIVDMEEVMDPDRETSASQDLKDYFAWVDKYIGIALAHPWVAGVVPIDYRISSQYLHTPSYCKVHCTHE